MGVDRAQYVQKRKGKYMAQVLEEFEKVIEPHLTPEAEGDVQSFKGLVRMRMNALATDAIDLMALGEAGEQNGVAMEIRDRLHPTGRP